MSLFFFKKNKQLMIKIMLSSVSLLFFLPLLDHEKTRLFYNMGKREI